MKNVIKIALLSTVAMVGTAQAEVDAAAVGVLQTAINSVYTAAGIDGIDPTVVTALNTLTTQIDQIYAAEDYAFEVTGIDWSNGFAPIYETVIHNDTAAADINDSTFATNVASLKSAINSDVWGAADGIASFDNTNFAAGLTTIAGASSGTLSTQAQTLNNNIIALNTALADYENGVTTNLDAVITAGGYISGSEGSAAAFAGTATATLNATGFVVEHADIGIYNSVADGYTSVAEGATTP